VRGRWFTEAVETPWTELQGGLALGGEELLGRARSLIGRKKGHDQARWTAVEQAAALRDRVRELVKDEPDEIKIWARIYLGRERRVEVARDFGYQDGSGVAHLLNVMKRRAEQDKRLRGKLGQLTKRQREFTGRGDR
jgi:hypothetical protein